MGKHCAAFLVVGESISVVDALVPAAATDLITINSDTSWKLQSGDRAQAYSMLHQRCSDYLRENGIELVYVKASALPTGSAKLALLGSAEVRGVVIAAAASVCPVKLLSKAVISRTYGNRKVDEYLKDDSFWSSQTTGGSLRKSSREAAMLLVAGRK